MSLFAARWSIDVWPMRAIVSLYLLTTGVLVAGAIWLVGATVQQAAAVSGIVAVKVFGLTLPVRQGGTAAFQVIAAGVAIVFLAATLLMWTGLAIRRAVAALAALLAGAAWWALVCAVVTQPVRPALAPSAVLAGLTAVVTLGVVAATLRRAPADRPVVDQARAAEADGGEDPRGGGDGART